MEGVRRDNRPSIQELRDRRGNFIRGSGHPLALTRKRNVFVQHVGKLGEYRST